MPLQQFQQPAGSPIPGSGSGDFGGIGFPENPPWLADLANQIDYFNQDYLGMGGNPNLYNQLTPGGLQLLFTLLGLQTPYSQQPVYRNTEMLPR